MRLFSVLVWLNDLVEKSVEPDSSTMYFVLLFTELRCLEPE